MHLLRQGYTHFSKYYSPLQNSRRQNGDMTRFPNGCPINIRHSPCKIYAFMLPEARDLSTPVLVYLKK
jgi:hypothetical protein